MWAYAHYAYLCRNIPSLSSCNLFAKQLLIQDVDPDLIFAGYSRTDAGVGVASSCQIPSVHNSGSVGNVANIVVCGLSILVGLALAAMALRRIAAVGKGEVAAFFGMYSLTCLFQLLDTGAFINQGSAAIVWVTAIHTGLVVAMFWMLLWIAFLSLQKVEDGTVPSWIFYTLPAFVLFVGSTYVALDIGFSVSGYFDTDIDSLQSAWLFSLTTLWPAVAILAYYLINIVVVKRILLEFKPILFFTATLFVFVLSQAARYALSHRICTGTDQKVDGSFLGTLLETATLGLLYASWQSITEDTWDDSLSALTPIQ